MNSEMLILRFFLVGQIYNVSDKKNILVTILTRCINLMLYVPINICSTKFELNRPDIYRNMVCQLKYPENPKSSVNDGSTLFGRSTPKDRFSLFYRIILINHFTICFKHQCNPMHAGILNQLNVY